MHTLVLNSFGRVYSFGCADRGVLGREGDNQPRLIESISFPMNNIAAGDVHSVAYNTEGNMVYRWGVYRVKKFNFRIIMEISMNQFLHLS
jgi:regulator of chromosome condensation